MPYSISVLRALDCCLLRCGLPNREQYGDRNTFSPLAPLFSCTLFPILYFFSLSFFRSERAESVRSCSLAPPTLSAARDGMPSQTHSVECVETMQLVVRCAR